MYLYIYIYMRLCDVEIISLYLHDQYLLGTSKQRETTHQRMMVIQMFQVF